MKDPLHPNENLICDECGRYRAIDPANESFVPIGTKTCGSCCSEIGKEDFDQQKLSP